MIAHAHRVARLQLHGLRDQHGLRGDLVPGDIRKEALVEHAFVGGASRGLGYACAEALAREGARVAICSRNEGALQAAAERLSEETGAEVVPFAADQTDRDELAQLCKRVDERFGGVDILVTNTGGPPAGDFFAHDEAAWDDAYQRLVMYVVRVVHAFLPGMRERGWGRIINITSTTVKEPSEGIVLSSVFRAGVVSLAKTLARQVARDGVTVNNVCPGAYDTERSRELMSLRARKEGLSLEEVRAAAEDGHPMGRILRPKELGALVAFLASLAARTINGTTIQADGGSTRGLL